ncbi:hypothetical protein DB30_01999 [Enhygromyxa salina]|uniref:Uncharacterized protein n=2 Tax=Enhygromyxa salina TaxID=215803 RepID=A0A0C2DEK2_9BACT|nr:hypothetical protein DB30_01999 [Enhygromyxa salina]
MLAAPACVALELPGSGQDEDSESGDDGCDPEGDPCDPTHALSGELILFVNARLSDDAFQTHLPLDEEGTYIGNAMYLYDPVRECEDGGNACRLTKLGHLRLDAQLGEVSVADKSLRKFVVRDLAWHPQQGLWAASFDSLNDEWSISGLEVPDWGRTDNLIGVERWVIPPGPAESPSTDPCYWFEAVSGLGFAGDELLLGVRGAGSKGLVTDGSLLRVNLSVLEQGHCVHPSDISQDPHYYACDVVCEQWCSFGQKLGVAGDVIEDLEGVGASAWLRSEDETVMALGHNELSSCVAPAPGEVATAEPDNVFIDDVVRGDEIEGLARVGGQLYGLSVFGKVYAIDEVTRVVTQIDDLEGLFPDDGLRLRGATEIVVPATR